MGRAITLGRILVVVSLSALVTTGVTIAACGGDDGASGTFVPDGGEGGPVLGSAEPTCPRFAWVSRIGSGGSDQPSALALLENGTVAIGGSVDRDAVFGAGEPSELRVTGDAPDAGAGGDAGDAGDAGSPGPAAPSPRVGFVAAYSPEGAFLRAFLASSDGDVRVDVTSIAALPGSRVMALVAVSPSSSPVPASTRLTLRAAASSPSTLVAPTNAIVLVELDAGGALLSSRVVATGAPGYGQSRIVALPDGSIGLAIASVTELDPGTPEAVTEDRSLLVARYDAAGVRTALTTFRRNGASGFHRAALSPTPAGGLLVAASCGGDIVAGATGTAPIPLKCEAGMVASIDAAGALGFASPVGVTDTNPGIAGVFSYSGSTFVHVMRGTGMMEGLLGYDAKGAYRLHVYDDDVLYRASVSVVAGDYLYRLGYVSGELAKVQGVGFATSEPAVVIARGRGTRAEWARMLGPSPGTIEAAVASGPDLLVAGTFAKRAVFGVEPESAQRLVSAGGADAFVGKIVFAAGTCQLRAGDAGFPDATVKRSCTDGVDEFQSSPKAGPGAATFDYNCDGVEERELDGLLNAASCTWSGAGCPSPGWASNTVPRCGETGTYIDCKGSGSYQCSSNMGPRVQRCR